MSHVAAFLKGFQSHPASVNETYFGHMRFALGFAGMLFLAGGAALVHALIPPLCETTASRLIQRLHARLSSRH
ncbi:MAG: DUF6356 family protein [Pseudomonadota bacterium]